MLKVKGFCQNKPLSTNRLFEDKKIKVDFPFNENISKTAVFFSA
jgi:hypothetical protein